MEPLSLITTPPLPEHPHPIVLIGAGGIVTDAHLPAYRKAGFPVAGIYDLNQDKAHRVAQAFNLPIVYPSLAAAIESAPPNAVFDIAVPASALPEVLPQLPDGAGVLIQKPMGENLTEARVIRDLCHVKQLKAGINFQLRYAPYVLAARSLIEQGYLGQIHDMEVRITAYTPFHLWKFMESVPFAEIVYHSIHYLDLMRAFLGEPHGIYGKTVWHSKMAWFPGLNSTFALDYGDFLRAVITTNHHHEYGPKHQESYIKWEGSLAAIKARIGLMLNYPTGMPDEFEYCLLEKDQEPAWHVVPIEGSWFPDAFIGTMASVMRFVEGSADRIPTSIDDAYRTMALVDAACRSSQSGAVPVNFD